MKRQIYITNFVFFTRPAQLQFAVGQFFRRVENGFDCCIHRDFRFTHWFTYTLHYNYLRVVFISYIEFYQDKIYVTRVSDKGKVCIVNLKVVEGSFLEITESMMTYDFHMTQIFLEQIESKFVGLMERHQKYQNIFKTPQRCRDTESGVFLLDNIYYLFYPAKAIANVVMGNLR